MTCQMSIYEGEKFIIFIGCLRHYNREHSRQNSKSSLSCFAPGLLLRMISDTRRKPFSPSQREKKICAPDYDPWREDIQASLKVHKKYNKFAYVCFALFFCCPPWRSRWIRIGFYHFVWMELVCYWEKWFMTDGVMNKVTDYNEKGLFSW